MVDAAVQRTNMVDSQVRPSDVTDRRIVRAMQDVARDEFVPEAQRPIAYSDGDVPQGSTGRVLMAPRVFAKLVQLAEIEPTDSVLVVGSGTGYAAAVLAKLAKHVFALESDGGLAAEARRKLAAVTNVTFASGPLPQGDPAGASFDVIFVDGAITSTPDKLLGQLAEHGRLTAIERSGSGSKAVVWTRSGGKSVSKVTAFDAATALLPGFAPEPSFVF